MAVKDAFVLGFRNGSWIQELKAEGTEEVWSFASDKAWLAVPLSHRSEIIGFVVLDRATPAVALDWEVFDLLRAAGRQAASYLAEERSTKVLRDSQLLTEYSKRFAFVVHDIKNVASQLDLIMSNSRRHIGDPEFQRDMLQTVEDAVARMNKLLNQLRANAAPRQPRMIDPNLVIDAVVAEFAAAKATIEVRKDAAGSAVAIAPDRLRSALISSCAKRDRCIGSRRWHHHSVAPLWHPAAD